MVSIDMDVEMPAWIRRCMCGYMGKPACLFPRLPAILTLSKIIFSILNHEIYE
jgi:hypothetical protein